MFQREPVLIILNGLGACVSSALAALVLVDVINWDPAQITGVVAAVTAICGLVSLALRSVVVSPATDEARIDAALASVIPGELIELEGIEPLDVDALAGAVAIKLAAVQRGELI